MLFDFIKVEFGDASGGFSRGVIPGSCLWVAPAPLISSSLPPPQEEAEEGALGCQPLIFQMEHL